MKLALAFGACLVLATILGVSSVNRMETMDKTMHAALGDSVTGLHALADINANARHLRTLQFQHILAKSSSARDGFEKDMAKAITLTDNAMDEYRQSVTDPVDSKNYQVLDSTWKEYIACHQTEYLPLSRSDKDNEAESLMNGKMRTNFHIYTGELDDMLKWNDVRAQWYGRQVTHASHRAITTVASLLIFTLLVATITGFLISRFITRSLAQVSTSLDTLEKQDLTQLTVAMQAMQAGDLTVSVTSRTEPVSIRSKDEIGLMAETFNRMLAKVKTTIEAFQSSQATLGDMVTSIQQSAEQVSTASQTLASSSEQIAAGSHQIAATMEEVSTATDQSARGATEVAAGATNQAEALGEGAELVKQLVLAVNSVARDAEATAHSAEHANSVASDGAAAVTEAIEGMERIRSAVSKSAEVIQSLGQASTQIGAIVGAIEEIADQTNLLALNAAIEAARAGEAGRGFAVVADEVRKLAERSRSATHEIGQLIERVQSHTSEAVNAMQVGSLEVGKGCELAEGAGEALSQIKREMSSVSDQIQNICSAAEEMLASSEEVSRSISEVTVVVQESSAAAEEMSASAEEVSASVQTVAGTVAEQSSAVQQLVDSSTKLADIAASLMRSADQFVTHDTAGKSVDIATSTSTVQTFRKAA